MKASGGDRIAAELFQILKDDAVKVLHSNASKFGKLSNDHSTRKGWFSFQYQRKAIPKNVQTTVQLHSFHILTKQCLKSFKLGSTVHKVRTSHVQVGFRKGRGTRYQIVKICWITEKASEFQKNICFIS